VLCAVIADDLTGACDSGAQFAAVGLRTTVALSKSADSEVVAYSTDSRDVDPAEAVCRLRRLAGQVNAKLLFKKIDSTLRGNTAVEIREALDVFGCELALVNPAFPAMGRVVEKGKLRVTSDPLFRPIDIAAALQPASCADGDSRFATFDAVEQSDLAAKAEAMFADPRKILWAGSAGLASALARLIGDGGPFDLPVPRPGPALFCIGSNHPVTVEQARRLVVRRPGHVILRLDRGRFDGLSGFRPSALVLSGGDTASLVCRSIGADSIDLRRELAPGVPAGILRGGELDGTPVVTKSGGFGAPDDLIHIADYFHA
jgi:uncharacterized protein YgbK (DUF1537 family)